MDALFKDSPDDANPLLDGVFVGLHKGLDGDVKS